MKNKTKNLIPVKESDNIWEILYPYLLNSKIIVQSYVYGNFQKLVKMVSYLKYLKINHGIRLFKVSKDEFGALSLKKTNTIISSPYEYEIARNILKLNDNNIYIAGLPRYDRFENIIKNKTEKQCILISFTYRSFNYSIFRKSLYKKNILELLNDESLISSLKDNNIELIFIQHHYDSYRNYSFNEKLFSYAKYKIPKFLSHYIEQCSLLVTDFSSISFDFIFQNKPTLFYLIDYNDTYEFREKKIMENFPKFNFTKGNTFYDKQKIIEVIQYYINKKFEISNKLKKNYEYIFYYKKNITEIVIKAINNIIEKKENIL